LHGRKKETLEVGRGDQSNQKKRGMKIQERVVEARLQKKKGTDEGLHSRAGITNKQEERRRSVDRWKKHNKLGTDHTTKRPTRRNDETTHTTKRQKK
jgi:hypothetical protein